MREFHESKGISQNILSLQGPPQQNGVVERKNRTLIEVARTMLEDSKLPTYFWAEAINTTFLYSEHIHNQQCSRQNCLSVDEMKEANSRGFFMSLDVNVFVLRNQGENLGKFEAKS